MPDGLRQPPAGARCGQLATTRRRGLIAMHVFNTIRPRDVRGEGRSFFIQDEWRPASIAIARIGARYDNVGYFSDDGTKAKALTR